ncbi:MAG: hypothetical protein DSM107014_13620 [Gomphosphaeria aponina SAG 52.96 = DSM 107014]|uniref:Uncharacterized protein n=1 Tax=Gomphosphaeria aponina SAG 52.96 = DSM 107014 TaxID=1521640 RepID=A0A941GWB7_9CHRO|nr:hypothetical protein [Gomphosphaeria aponina SAG 52.96 = DSM 107014]
MLEKTLLLNQNPPPPGEKGEAVPEQSTINHQLSTINHQPSKLISQIIINMNITNISSLITILMLAAPGQTTINYQPSTINHQPSTINHQLIYAETAEINHTLSREEGESYDVFVVRSENLAKITTDSRFEQDKLATIIKVTILGESGGAIAPILSLEVSRQDWIMNPNPQSWITYFPGSKLLLGFEQTTPPGETPPTQTLDFLQKSISREKRRRE